MNKNTLKIAIFFAIIVCAGIIILAISKSLVKEEDNSHLKKYKSNEYIPTYVSNEDMTKIYLNDYIFYMRTDLSKAYELLDKNYRKKKFNSFDDFKNYLNEFLKNNFEITKYSKYNKNGYIVYVAYDKLGRALVFKTRGVMVYRVYLDEETVEIG